MHFYVHLVDTKFTKWSNFVREAWLIKEKWNKPSCLKPPMNADARRCSAPLTGVNRRASAVPYPRRYEVCSLRLAMLPEERLFEEKSGAAFDAFAKQLQHDLAAPGTRLNIGRKIAGVEKALAVHGNDNVPNLDSGSGGGHLVLDRGDQQSCLPRYLQVIGELRRQSHYLNPDSRVVLLDRSPGRFKIGNFPLHTGVRKGDLVGKLEDDGSMIFLRLSVFYHRRDTHGVACADHFQLDPGSRMGLLHEPDELKRISNRRAVPFHQHVFGKQSRLL